MPGAAFAASLLVHGGLLAVLLSSPDRPSVADLAAEPMIVELVSWGSPAPPLAAEPSEEPDTSEPLPHEQHRADQLLPMTTDGARPSEPKSVEDEVVRREPKSADVVPVTLPDPDVTVAPPPEEPAANPDDVKPEPVHPPVEQSTPRGPTEAADRDAGLATPPTWPVPSAKAIDQYAASVRKAIARVPLTGSGRRGRVVVEFVLDASGRVEAVRLRETSGRADVDAAAAAVIAAARFPRPPPGMTEGERTYVIPFEFR